MSSLIPAGVVVPPGMDQMQFFLSLPAMGPDRIPPGADTTMTTNGPDQVWFTVTAATCVTTTALFLILRLYTRLVIVRSLEVADYILLLAFPLIVTQIGLGYMMVQHGAGVHQWQVTIGQLFNQLYWANIAQIVYCPLSFLVKIAVLYQYLRLFAPSRSANPLMWYGAWSIIVALWIIYSFFTYWTIWYCKPRRAIWDKLTPDARCSDVNDIILSQGAFNMASDIVILGLPTISLWKLKVPRERKIFITMLFSMGLLTCVASSMRIVFTVKISPVISESDVSHNGLFIGLWTEAEVSLAFIVACALCLPKLIQAKGNKIRMALSYATFSTFRNTTRHSLRPCKRESQCNQLVGLQRVHSEESAQARQQVLNKISRTYPERDSLDMTVHSNSNHNSLYPDTSRLESKSRDQYGFWPSPLKISKTALVPVKLDVEQGLPEKSMPDEGYVLQDPDPEPSAWTPPYRTHRRNRSVPKF